jgi:hypothetical protein
LSGRGLFEACIATQAQGAVSAQSGTGGSSVEGPWLLQAAALHARPSPTTLTQPASSAALPRRPPRGAAPCRTPPPAGAPARTAWLPPRCTRLAAHWPRPAWPATAAASWCGTSARPAIQVGEAALAVCAEQPGPPPPCANCPAGCKPPRDPLSPNYPRDLQQPATQHRRARGPPRLCGRPTTRSSPAYTSRPLAWLCTAAQQTAGCTCERAGSCGR